MKTKINLQNLLTFLLFFILSTVFSFVVLAQDYMAASKLPPGNLATEDVPLFVSIGFDDNGYSGLDGSGGTGGANWIYEYTKNLTNNAGSNNTGTFDGAPIRLSFYMAGTYGDKWMSESNAIVRKAWAQLYQDGHEIGNHTYSHPHGSEFSESQWGEEIDLCNDVLIKPYDPNEPSSSPDPTAGIGLDINEMYGFRAPYAEYSVPLFNTLKSKNYVYDCSVEEGWSSEQDGTNFYWPYTLDNGSPGHDLLVEWGLKEPMNGGVAGVWEIPVYVCIVPPDDKCAEYGIPTGLRAKCKGIASWFDEASGKITGVDYNLFVLFKMNKAEYLATIKYTLDQRLTGNRCPFPFVGHTDFYSSKYTAAPNISATERQEAVEEFLEYAISKPEVRVVRYIDIINWMKNPVPLEGAGEGPFILNVTQPEHGSIDVSSVKTEYNKDETVTLTAVPESGYEFTGWTGNLSGSTNPSTITMTSDQSISATFSLIPGQCNNETDLLKFGTVSSYADNMGSEITHTAESDLVTTSYTVIKQPQPDQWPWIDLSIALPSGNMDGLSNIKVTYISDQPLLLVLPQPVLSETGETYQYTLPASSSESTVNITPNDLIQPAWTSAGSQAIALDLPSVNAISFAPAVETSSSSVSGTFEIHGLELCGVNMITTQISNKNVTKINMFQTNKALNIIVPQNNNYQIQIFDISGAEIGNEIKYMHSGINIYELSDLNSGLYIIRILSSDQLLTKRLYINK